MIKFLSFIRAIWDWWQSWKAEEKQETVEEVHRQDVETDTEVNQQIEDLHERVDHAESEEAGAGEVSGALDDYFLSGGEKH